MENLTVSRATRVWAVLLLFFLLAGCNDALPPNTEGEPTHSPLTSNPLQKPITGGSFVVDDAYLSANLLSDAVNSGTYVHGFDGTKISIQAEAWTASSTGRKLKIPSVSFQDPCNPSLTVSYNGAPVPFDIYAYGVPSNGVAIFTRLSVGQSVPLAVRIELTVGDRQYVRVHNSSRISGATLTRTAPNTWEFVLNNASFCAVYLQECDNAKPPGLKTSPTSRTVQITGKWVYTSP